MVKVEGTLEELADLFANRGSPTRTTRSKASKAGRTPSKTKRKSTAWQRFLKSFKFRKQKRNESNSAYFGARTKAASRAYKRRKK